MKRKTNKIKVNLFFLALIAIILFLAISKLNPQIINTIKNTFNNKEANTNSDTIDPTQWVAVDGLGRTLDTNEETGDVKSDKDVGIFFWNWHDTETVMYRRDKASTKDPVTAFNTFENVEPYNIQNAIDKYPNENPLNINSIMWENHQGYMWWNKPIYGYYRNSDKWVLRRQVELLADAGIDFILLDYTNTSGTGASFKNERGNDGCYVKSEETGSRRPYWENRFSYCWDWRPLFEVFEKAKEDGIDVPKIGFMLSFSDQDKYAPSIHGGQKGNNEMLLCLYDNLYKLNKYEDLWYYRDGKPFIMSYEPVINENDVTFKQDFSADDINELKSIKNMFTFRNPGNNNVGSVLDVDPKQNGWAWESLYPQYYGKSGNTIEEVPVSPAQNVGYDENGNRVGTPMNFDNSRGRDMPRDDNFLSRLSSFEKQHSNFTGNYTYLYKGKEVNVNSSINNSYLYGRNFQQQWDRAISLDPKSIFITGWNEWVVVRNPHEGNVNKFIDEFNDLKSRDIEPSAGKLKDHYYYQMVENIRKFKGTNKLPNQINTKTIDLEGDVNQWNDKNIIDYNHYINKNEDTLKRNYKSWGSPDEQTETYTNYTSSEGNDLKKAKVSYDNTYLYFYIEVDKAFRNYGIDRTRLLIDTIDSENSTSTKNWEEFEYILNRNNATENTLKLERSKGGWNWEEVGQVEYTTADSEGHGNNVLQVKIPRKYLGLTSENVKFNYKWIDNNVTDENGTTADIMNVYIDGDAAPGGRFAFAFTGNAEYEEETYTISLNLNGGTLEQEQITYKESTETFILPTPTRKGYIFRGWTGMELSNVTMVVTIPKGSSGNKTYTANWSKDEYTITYNLNGGTLSDMIDTYQVDTATFTLPTPTRKGYKFTGWTGTGLEEATQEVTIEKGSTGHRDYVANWSLTTYAITYNLEGGTITGQKTSYNITTETFTLPTPTKEGYTFEGWTGTGLTEQTKTVTVTKGSIGKRTYTANWSKDEYTITYNLDGGTITGQKTVYDIDTESYTLPTPIKEGYTFKGWTGTGLTEPTQTVTIEKGSIGDRTYIANWSKGNYKIEYNLNGGTITGQKTAYDIDTETFTLPTPTKEGYTFEGWTGTGLTEPTQTVTVVKGSIGNREYTANWSEKIFNIKEYEVEGNIIQKVKPNTQYKDLIKNIETNLNYTVEEKGRSLKEEDIIKTGQEIVVEDKSYILVVNGDTNGDGKADIKDLLQLNKHRLNKVNLENEFFIAGDVNDDNKIDIKDIMKLNKYRLNKITEL